MVSTRSGRSLCIASGASVKSKAKTYAQTVRSLDFNDKDVEQSYEADGGPSPKRVRRTLRGEEPLAGEVNLEDSGTGNCPQQDPYLSHYNQRLEDLDHLLLDSGPPDLAVAKSTVNIGGRSGVLVNVKTIENKDAPLAEWPFLHPKIKQRLLAEEPFCSLQERERALLNLLSVYSNCFDFKCGMNSLHKVRAVYTIHVVNHLLKSRGLVYANNSTLKSASCASDKRTSSGSGQEEVHKGRELRDQGLVRPKVLILTPMRNSAYKIMKLIMVLFAGQKKGFVANRKKLFRLYYTPSDSKKKISTKPPDFFKMFHGNTDDCFRFGVQFGRQRMKLFSDFYMSDLIVASPLGLRMAMGGEADKKWDVDFLSSLEIVVLDQADVFAMQNLDHVMFILENTHRRPADSHGVDFSRVRELWLDEDARGGSLVCQYLVFAAVRIPEIHSLVQQRSRNTAGSLILDEETPFPAISSISGKLPQAFHRFSTSSVLEEPNDRYNFFFDKVFPSIADSQAMEHTLIVVPSYFDFVRIRNRLKTDNESFVQICEYTEKRKMIRSRDMFYHGRRKFCLLTERIYFYRRYRIKGVQHVVFYQLPMYPNFYSELCNSIDRGTSSTFHTCTVVYSKFDAFRMAGVLGSAHARNLLASDKNVHMIMSE